MHWRFRQGEESGLGAELKPDRFIDSFLRVWRIRVDAMLRGHHVCLTGRWSTMLDQALAIAARPWGNEDAETRSPAHD